MSEKIKVTICAGTACFVMGASEIMLLEEELPAHLKDKVEIDGVTCMGFCKDATKGKAPFVKINDEIMAAATMISVIEKIEQLAGV